MQVNTQLPIFRVGLSNRRDKTFSSLWACGSRLWQDKETPATSGIHHDMPVKALLQIQKLSLLLQPWIMQLRAASLAGTLGLGGKNNPPHCLESKTSFYSFCGQTFQKETGVQWGAMPDLLPAATSSVLNLNFPQWGFPLRLGRNLSPLPRREQKEKTSSWTTGSPLQGNTNF